MSQKKVSARSRFSELAAALVVGMLIDVVDLATFGPVGLWTGMLVGGLVGWLASPLYGHFGLGAGRRWVVAALTGLYCMLPFTAAIPLATAIALAHTISGGGRRSRSAGQELETADKKAAIDVEFRPISDPSDKTDQRKSSEPR